MPTATEKFDEMTPKEIVNVLDKYVVGQDDAKRMIAIALRNRVRRKKLPLNEKEEISPKNIMMIGSTGIGKTEIARRIARIAGAPFVKVEATKYTEVGYVGRDVESMVRDLAAQSVMLVKNEIAHREEKRIDEAVNSKLLDLLLPILPSQYRRDGESAEDEEKRVLSLLIEGVLDNEEVEVKQSPSRGTLGSVFLGQGGQLDDLQDAINRISFDTGARRQHKRRVSVKRAREILKNEELEKVIDQDKLVEEAINRAEEMGIIFIDEIDKIAQSSGNEFKGDVSKEGVQRDLLPIIEGSKVNTKWGLVDTSNILFISAGAFSLSKPSDLIPELQGRFPLRVELKDLTADDFFRILKEPQHAMTKQYKALLSTENIDLVFTDEALREIAQIAYDVNLSNENIGARRLYTVMEKLLEELSFSADQLAGQRIEITKEYVKKMLSSVVEKQDISKYIL